MPQIETCDECGREYPRRRMVRKLRAYGYDASIGGQNKLTYSSYNTGLWTCSSADAGRVSMGLYGDYFRPTFSGTTGTEARGSQTWTASGTLRTSTSTSLSGMTNVLFGIHVGAYHAQTTQTLTVVIGCCDVSGTAIAGTSTSFTVNGSKLCWWTQTLASLEAAGVVAASAYFYATVTISGATSKWWADGAIVCDRTTVPVGKPQTKGSARARSGMGFTYSVPVLCPECAKEKLFIERDKDPRTAEWDDIPERIESPHE